MTGRTRTVAAALSVLAVAALAVFGSATVLAKTTKPATKPKKDIGTSYTALVGQKNGFDYTAGVNVDKVLGRSAVVYKNKILPSGKPGTLTVNADPVTIYTKTGTLYGTATATLVIGTGGAATVTKGTLTLTKATGGEKGHSLTASLTGTGNVNTGVYTFHYKGTYK